MFLFQTYRKLFDSSLKLKVIGCVGTNATFYEMATASAASTSRDATPGATESQSVSPSSHGIGRNQVPIFRPPSASQSPPAQPMPVVPPAPSFFANPFMAPFMPQNASTQPSPYQSECFDGNGSSPPSVTPEAALPTSGAEFRINPLTGGYFLSPGQYQEMMQQYVQSLMLAASAAPPTVDDQSFNELKDAQNNQDRCSLYPETSQCFSSNASGTFSATTTMGSNPVSIPTTDSQISTTNGFEKAVDLKNVTNNLGLLSIASSETPNSTISATLLMESPQQTLNMSTLVEQHLAESCETKASTSKEEIDNSEKLQGEVEGHNSDECMSNENTNNESEIILPKEDNSIQPNSDSTAEEPHENSDPAKEADQEKKIEAEEAQSSKERTSDENKPSQKKSTNNANGVSNPTNNSNQTSYQDRRTSELIKKQINEIEKEISRRIQNKNVKKMNEVELAQLLSDHGFGNFVGFSAEGVTDSIRDEAGLPYRPPSPPSDISETTKATLNQLRSSFSPPPSAQTSESPTPIQAPYSVQNTLGMHQTAGGTAMFGAPSSVTGGFHGPAAFMTSPVLPQQNNGFEALGQVQSQAQSPSSFPQQFNCSPVVPAQPQASLPYFVPPQYQFGHQQPPGFGTQFQNSQVLPPTQSLVPNISPEIAAALLQQLQQQNPGLIETLVEQQRRDSRNQSPQINHDTLPGNAASISRCATIPAPPMPQSNVSRRSNDNNVRNNRRLSSGSSTGNCHTTESRINSQKVASSSGEMNGWLDMGKGRHNSVSSNTSGSCGMDMAMHSNGGNGEDKENGPEPIWVMRDSYLKRLQRDEQRNKEHSAEASRNNDANNSTGLDRQTNAFGEFMDSEEQETDKLLHRDRIEGEDDKPSIAMPLAKKSSTNKKEVMVHEPAVLIEGVLFRSRYLGSTQLVCDGRPTKTSRMVQAQEAVARVKAPDGEIQPSTEIDLFISTEKIMVLNTDLQRISETDVRQDILMDHSLRSISYIADIGDLVVLMARRVPQSGATGDQLGTLNGASGSDDEEADGIRRAPRVVCHVFESEEASFIAQSIGQAFQVAYVEFLRANGIDDPAYLREIDYQDVLNSQELMGEELEMFARKETQKDVIVPKKVGEALGIVVVESGWGSMLPTVVVANMAPGGPASRSNQLNIGDQNAKTSTAVRLTVVSTPPVVEVRIKRPDTKYQLGFSVQNGVICSLLRGGIAERGGIRVGHRIIEINHMSVVAVPHERIVNMLATATGEIHMKTMPTSMFRLLTGQEVPNYI
ncbi:phosphotyrosine interaction domain (PTB/PID) domain-containing protein [Ditylenchus destructor]|nr:phosphotyrosine interaction domain (PTB/PID) domain-containing protein [Ditylenchus destructor]